MARHDLWTVRPMPSGEQVIICTGCGAFISEEIEQQTSIGVGPLVSRAHSEAMRLLAGSAEPDAQG